MRLLKYFAKFNPLLEENIKNDFVEEKFLMIKILEKLKNYFGK